jgi:formyltetrahydrofolate deformylase
MGVGRLVVTCSDRPGIVAAVSAFLHARSANITHADQHSTDPIGGRFFLRVVLHLDELEARLPELRQAFADEVATPLGMSFTLTNAATPKRTAVMVSREDHCALDLLWRARRGELPDLDIALVISNHADLEEAVAAFGVPFHVVEVSGPTKVAAEQRQLELLSGCELVVLARYMQILSGDFLERVGAPVINIHHSFLPAFAGAAPYVKAKARGVKLIGATAHYVVEELDAGPIIEQDVIRVTHREDVDELIRQGRDIERQVLARAVRAHAADRVLVDGATTVVF